MHFVVLSGLALQLWGAALALFSLPIYMHHLGAEEMGIIGFYSAIQAIFAVLEGAVCTTILKRIESVNSTARVGIKTKISIRSMEMLGILILAMATLLGLVFAPLILIMWSGSNALPMEELLFALVTVFFASGLRVFDGVYKGEFYATGRQHAFNSLSALLVGVRYGMGLYLVVVAGMGATALVLNGAIVSLAGLLLLGYTARRGKNRESRKAEQTDSDFKGIARDVFMVSKASAYSTVFIQCDRIILAFAVPFATLGLYSLATAAAGVLFIMVVPATQAIFHALASSCTKKYSLGIIRSYGQMLKYVIWLVAPLCMVLCANPGSILLAWSGEPERYQLVATILQVIALGHLLNIMAFVPIQFLLASNNAGLLNKLYGNLLALSLVLIGLSTSKWGANGAAWSWVALNVFLYIGVLNLARRASKIGRLIASITFRKSLPAIIVCMLTYLFSGYTPMGATSRLEGVVDVASYYLLSLVFYLLVNKCLAVKKLGLSYGK